MHRDRGLDFLRGTAILFMIITHTTGVFYSGDNIFLTKISWWGGTVCFTIFLFVFGAVYGLKLHKGSLVIQHEIKRALLTLLGYYMVTLWVYIFFVWRFGAINEQFVSDVFGILSLGTLMYFTEFIVAFVINIFVIVVFQKQLRRLLRYPLLAVATAALFYIIGNVLYPIPFNIAALEIFKLHIFGNGSAHSFPLFWYAPVVMSGLLFGYWMRENREKMKRWTRIISGLLVGILAALYLIGNTSIERFPPTLAFLGIGLAYSLVIFELFPVIERFKQLESPIFYMGKHAFSFYFWHIMLLFPLGYWLGGATPDAFRTVYLFGVVMVGIYGLSMAKNKVSND